MIRAVSEIESLCDTSKALETNFGNKSLGLGYVHPRIGNKYVHKKNIGLEMLLEQEARYRPDKHRW